MEPARLRSHSDKPDAASYCYAERGLFENGVSMYHNGVDSNRYDGSYDQYSSTSPSCTKNCGQYGLVHVEGCSLHTVMAQIGPMPPSTSGNSNAQTTLASASTGFDVMNEADLQTWFDHLEKQLHMKLGASPVRLLEMPDDQLRHFALAANQPIDVVNSSLEQYQALAFELAMRHEFRSAAEWDVTPRPCWSNSGIQYGHGSNADPVISRQELLQLRRCIMDELEDLPTGDDDFDWLSKVAVMINYDSESEGNITEIVDRKERTALCTIRNTNLYDLMERYQKGACMQPCVTEPIRQAYQHQAPDIHNLGFGNSGTPTGFPTQMATMSSFPMQSSLGSSSSMSILTSTSSSPSASSALQADDLYALLSSLNGTNRQTSWRVLTGKDGKETIEQRVESLRGSIVLSGEHIMDKLDGLLRLCKLRGAEQLCFTRDVAIEASKSGFQALLVTATHEANTESYAVGLRPDGAVCHFERVSCVSRNSNEWRQMLEKLEKGIGRSAAKYNPEASHHRQQPRQLLSNMNRSFRRE